ncbi:MAG: hypothetical protein FVQ84_12500 [Planctomycetes bacterium]|nr:hypothetical protein [Planctomycetota bacterium]
MRKKSVSCNNIRTPKLVKKPNIKITKLGIVSHDYRHEEQNGYRDFSYHLKDILGCLDEQKCDSVLFSLCTIVPRPSFKTKRRLSSLRNIKSVFIEEFCDKGDDNRVPKRYVVYYKTSKGWQEYELHQQFGSLSKCKAKEIIELTNNVKKRKTFGKCAVLLCGESNIVKYSQQDRTCIDEYNYLNAVSGVSIFLNPIHDRMTRYEMKLKRIFLSENNKWVVSVWNKGKIHKDGKTRDGKDPAWTVYHNGSELLIDRINCTIPSNSSIEIGILDMREK